MSTQAPIGSILTSTTCRGHLTRERHAQLVGQIRLKPRTGQRAMHTISRAGGTLRRSAGVAHTALGGPTRRVRGDYAGLSNTRFPGRVRERNG